MGAMSASTGGGGQGLSSRRLGLFGNQYGAPQPEVPMPELPEPMSFPQMPSAPPPAPTMMAPQAMQQQPSQSPAMESLSSLASGEGFREGFMKEGWGSEGAPELDPPRGRQLPAASRALAQLVGQQGRAY